MFANFKKIFARFAGQDASSNPSSTLVVEEEIAAAPPAEGQFAHQYSQFNQQPPSRPASDSVAVSLKGVIELLPTALKAKVHHLPPPGLKIEVPTKQVTDQLASGSARITFGDLIQAAPPGVFVGTAGQESLMVELPLSEIIPQLNAASMSRRTGQRQLDLPPASWSVFGSKGEMIHQPKSPSAEKAAPPKRQAPSQPPKLPAAPTAHANTLSNGVRSEPPSPLPQSRVAPPAPVSAARSPGPIVPIATAPPPTNGPPASVPRGQDRSLQIKVEALMNGWPDAVLQEITRLQLAALPAVLPIPEVEQALRRGKLLFSWKQVRSWIKRLPPVTTASPNDEVKLDLPLSAIVPLFLAQHSAAARRRIEIGDNIPDVFAGPNFSAHAQVSPTGNHGEASQPTVAAPQRPSSATSDTIRDLGQVFGQTYNPDWTPADIVQKTSLLAGVSGSAVALEDGLLVASRMPPTLNAEALAGFLPQIFGSIAEYTKEVKLGDPTQIQVQFGALPLSIFKAGRIFFAVLGREGTSLPLNQLNLVAAHLGRQAATG